MYEPSCYAGATANGYNAPVHSANGAPPTDLAPAGFGVVPTSGMYNDGYQEMNAYNEVPPYAPAPGRRAANGDAPNGDAPNGTAANGHGARAKPLPPARAPATPE